MKVETPIATLDLDDDVERIAMLARKATRKASRVANAAGYSVQHAGGVCIVRSPGHLVRIEIKNTPTHVNKRYSFALEAQ